MDEFCGDVRNAWGISAKGYLTHCFDDLVLFGVTVPLPLPLRSLPAVPHNHRAAIHLPRDLTAGCVPPPS